MCPVQLHETISLTSNSQAMMSPSNSGTTILISSAPAVHLIKSPIPYSTNLLGNPTDSGLVKQEPVCIKTDNLVIKKESNEHDMVRNMHNSPTLKPPQPMNHQQTFTVIDQQPDNQQHVTTSSAATKEIIVSAVKQLEICDKILSIAQSHQISCSYTKLKREQLFESTVKCKKQLQLSVTLPSNSTANPALIDDMQRLEMWRCLCALIGPDIMRIVEFAKRIPGLCNKCFLLKIFANINFSFRF